MMDGGAEKFVVKAQRTRSHAKGKPKAEMIRHKSISNLPSSFETFRSNVTAPVIETPKRIPSMSSERQPFKSTESDEAQIRAFHQYRSAKKLQRHRSSPRHQKPPGSAPTPPRKLESSLVCSSTGTNIPISEIPESTVWKKNPEADAIRDMLIQQLAMQESEENRKTIQISQPTPQPSKKQINFEEESKQDKKSPVPKKSNILKLAMRRQKAASYSTPIDFSITRDDGETPLNMLTELRKEFDTFSNDKFREFTEEPEG